LDSGSPVRSATLIVTPIKWTKPGAGLSGWRGRTRNLLVSRWHRRGCTTRGTKKTKGEKVKRILTIEIEGLSVAPVVVNEAKDKIPEGTRVRIVVCDHRSLWDNATWHGKVLRSSFTD
jgi:hypothetical protein